MDKASRGTLGSQQRVWVLSVARSGCKWCSASDTWTRSMCTVTPALMLRISRTLQLSSGEMPAWWAGSKADFSVLDEFYFFFLPLAATNQGRKSQHVLQGSVFRHQAGKESVWLLLLYVKKQTERQLFPFFTWMPLNIIVAYLTFPSRVKNFLNGNILKSIPDNLLLFGFFV